MNTIDNADPQTNNFKKWNKFNFLVGTPPFSLIYTVYTIQYMIPYTK